MKRVLCAGLLASFLLAGAARAEAFTSEYTSLQDCRPTAHLRLPARMIQQGAFRCGGVDGFAVYVVDDDPRSFLVLERNGKLSSLEKPMVGDFALGDFPNVAGAKKAEWRLDAAGKAVGLVVRVSYLRTAAAGPPTSTLMAFDLRGPTPVPLGVTKTNDEARRLIDAAGAGRN